MKILIVYATRTGTTKSCAELLAAKLSKHDVTLADITLSGSMPDPSGYDFVAVGSPVRYGKLHGRVDGYLKAYGEKLKNTRAGYFICCGYVDSGDEYISKLIPQDLLASASAAECFGGELNLKKQKGIDRFITRLMINYVLDEGKRDGEMPERSLPEIMTDSISRFADAVKASMA
jgi:menaquinone-dependent protoporphyrinogen oxidase